MMSMSLKFKQNDSTRTRTSLNAGAGTSISCCFMTFVGSPSSFTTHAFAAIESIAGVSHWVADPGQTRAMAKRSIELRTCPLCEAMCGLELHVEDGRVALIRPDRDDVWSKGHICPKGTTLGHLHEDPDRVREPMIRDGDKWREASWDDAFARAEELIGAVLEQHGRDAMTTYIGNP